MIKFTHFIKRSRTLVLALLFIISQVVFSVGPLIKNQVALADTGTPSGTISATYDAATGQLNTSGQYSWSACTAGNTDKVVGQALFIDGPDANSLPGNPTQTPPTAEALDGTGMHLLNGGNGCQTDPGNWSDNSHNATTNPILAVAPSLVCVVIYHVDTKTASGAHSQIGAGVNRNTDNSYEENNNSYGIQVIDGKIDLNQDGAADGSDDGTLFGKTIINGQVDWNGDNAVNSSDDSPGADFNGFKVIDSKVDINADNTVNGSDDGFLSSSDATCVVPTIINQVGSLTVHKTFTDAHSNAGITITLTPGNVSQQTNASGDTTFSNLTPGSYSAVATEPSGYYQSATTCSNVLVVANQTANCTITDSPIKGTITVHKSIVGGTATPSNFCFTLSPDPGNGQVCADNNTGNAVFTNVPAGTYSASETTSAADYTQTSNNCTNLVIANNGDSVSCTIENTRNTGTITFLKDVIGGSAKPSDWLFNISDGSTATSGDKKTYPTGSYTVTEAGPADYTLTNASGACSLNGGVISLLVTMLGGTCTITNTRNTGTLRVIKHVINDNSGNAHANDFSLHVKQSGTDVTGSPAAGSETGTDYLLNTGTYIVSEDTPGAGYTQTSIVCDGQATDSVTVTTNTQKICTITNDDVPHPAIHVVKSSSPSNSFAHEGDVVTYIFTVTNTGDTVLSNVTVDDSIAGAGVYQSGDSNNDGNLDKTETWIYTKQYTIPTPQTADVANTVTACANDPARTQVCDTDDHQLDVLHPGLQVVKTGPLTAHPGDKITYTFTVTNTGDTPLDGLSVNDNVAGGGATLLSGDTNHDGKLDLNETWVYTVDYTIPANQSANIDNTVTVCGDDALQLQTCDTDDHHLVVLSTVIVTKYNDLDHSGTMDAGEPALPGWEMQLDNTKQTTGANGTTTFADVTPGAHDLKETAQTDWHLSSIHCTVNGREVGQAGQLDDYLLVAQPGATVLCAVGNFHDVVLNLTKSNNKPDPTATGDVVTYTLIVSLPTDSGEGVDTTVTDLPPKNFTYIPDSWTANSSIRGDLKPEVTPEPTYGSPGSWFLGTMLPGEIVVLTYQAKIGFGVSNGTYPDLAFARTCGQPFVGVCNNVVFSNVRFAAIPFVGTKVSITSAQVLGANVTLLVNTGTHLIVFMSLAALTLLAAGLFIVTRRQTFTTGGYK